MCPKTGGEGVIVAQGGASVAGACTSTTAGPRTATTSSASSDSKSTGEQPFPPGEHRVRMEFAYDGGGLGKGGT